MFKVLVVDDNVTDLNGIIDCVPWNSMNCSIVGAARNGLAGYEVAQKFQPDIVITDISMPQMNGIEMCKKIKEIYPKTYVIFISCLEDFETVHSAIDLDAIGYVTKPINIDDIIKNVLKATNMKQEEIDTTITIYNLKKQIKHNLPYLVENFFRNILLKTDIDNDSIIKTSEELDINLHSQLALVICQIEKADENGIFPIQQLISIFSSIIPSENFCCCVNYSSKLVAVILYNSTQTEIIEWFDKIQNKLHEVFYTNIITYIGNESNTIYTLPTNFDLIMNCIKNNYVNSANNVVIVSEIEETSCSNILDVDKIYQDLKIELTDENKNLDLFIEKYFSDNNLLSIKQLAFTIYFQLELILKEISPSLVFDDDVENKTTLINTILISDDVNSTKKIILSLLENAKKQMILQNTSSSEYIVKSIKNIVETQYSTLNSAEEIAKQIYLSLPYSNRIFKSKTGYTIYDYLLNYRMYIAKKLLSRPNYKAYEIAELVGYSNNAYFSTAFKNHTGLTPIQYRNKISNSRS